MDKNNLKALVLFAIVLICIIGSIAVRAFSSLFSMDTKNENTEIIKQDAKSVTFKIISSQENKNLESIVDGFAKTNGYNIQIEYAGTLDIMSRLNQGEKFDGVWLSNSIWSYMLDSSVKLTNAKCTSINPVLFAIKKSKAQELDFIDKTIYTKDIVQAIADGKLKFSMSNPTVTNSGASAYLGMLSTLAGNPEVLTKDILDDANLKTNLKTLFTGLERSSGDEDFLEELFLNGNYEAVVTYESSIININKKLAERGQETLYAIYPIDGVSISDSPFGYIDNKEDAKKQIFTELQTYLLSNEGQKLLQQKGKRTWYGGVSDNVDKTIFNPEWGIDTTKYISPIKYPSTEVIKLALNLYQNELRKPVHVVFCLDYSGSMQGTGEKELREAMDYILTEKAANDFIQFSAEDKIDIIPFEDTAHQAWSTENGTKTEELLNQINSYEVGGTTALYPACVEALELIKNEDREKYNLSIVLMTDGLGNRGTFDELKNKYKEINKPIPIYSIMFGSASEYQLNQISILTNAKTFNGKNDLVGAFKEVRGYN